MILVPNTVKVYVTKENMIVVSIGENEDTELCSFLLHHDLAEQISAALKVAAEKVKSKESMSTIH